MLRLRNVFYLQNQPLLQFFQYAHRPHAASSSWSWSARISPSRWAFVSEEWRNRGLLRPGSAPGSGRAFGPPLLGGVVQEVERLGPVWAFTLNQHQPELLHEAGRCTAGISHRSSRGAGPGDSILALAGGRLTGRRSPGAARQTVRIEPARKINRALPLSNDF